MQMQMQMQYAKCEMRNAYHDCFTKRTQLYVDGEERKEETESGMWGDGRNKQMRGNRQGTWAATAKLKSQNEVTDISACSYGIITDPIRH
jgi:hypothetical protein